jgi:regulator of sigma E protease
VDSPLTLLFGIAFDPIGILRAAFLLLLLLIPLIVIHELGHFVAARIFNIKVLEFGIGFPPRIKKATMRRGETEYTLNWLPIGGFVRLLGEEDPSDPRSLAAASAWKRLIVLYAGVFMNVVLAVVLLGFGFMIPRDRPLTMAQIVEVAPESPAAEARIVGSMVDGSEPEQGLQPGDLVLEVQGRDIKNTNELVYATRLHLGKTQTWLLNRGGSLLEAEVYARFHPPPGQGATGIRISAPITCSDVDADGNPINCELLYPYSESQWYWPWEAIPRGAQSLYEVVILTKSELQVRIGGSSSGGTPNGNDTPVFTGPVGIADLTSQLVDQAGWRSLIEIAALLSLSLAVLNALPIPALDGGRALFVFVEIIRGGKRISPEREGLVHLIGMALLFSGIIVITYLDIVRIIT